MNRTEPAFRQLLERYLRPCGIPFSGAALPCFVASGWEWFVDYPCPEFGRLTGSNRRTGGRRRDGPGCRRRGSEDRECAWWPLKPPLLLSAKPILPPMPPMPLPPPILIAPLGRPAIGTICHASGKHGCLGWRIGPSSGWSLDQRGRPVESPPAVPQSPVAACWEVAWPSGCPARPPDGYAVLVLRPPLARGGSSGRARRDYTPAQPVGRHRRPHLLGAPAAAA
jgi:hypothetical protein